MRSSFTLTGHDDYSPAIADLICERLMEGASLRQIYQDRNMPARSIAITHLVGLRISPTILPSRNSRAAERQLQAGADVCFRLKVLPEPISARRSGSPSPPFRQIRRWREHLLLSWRRSSRCPTNCLRQQQPVSLRPLPSHRGTRQWPANHGGRRSGHPMSLPHTLLKSLATASSRFSGFASMPLTASEVKRPREM